MRSLLLGALLAVCASLLVVNEAHAQAPGYFGVEGQITDIATGRPLSGVRVVFRQTRATDGLILNDSTVVTDGSGFYQFETFQVADTYPTVVVWCQTPKGDVVTTLPLYSKLKDQGVYVRNAALGLPKRVTRCTPPTPVTN
jgi:hypothetical protein